MSRSALKFHEFHQIYMGLLLQSASEKKGILQVASQIIFENLTLHVVRSKKRGRPGLRRDGFVETDGTPRKIREMLFMLRLDFFLNDLCLGGLDNFMNFVKFIWGFCCRLRQNDFEYGQSDYF